MAERGAITYQNMATNSAFAIDVSEFIDLVVGSSITSLAQMSDGGVEFGLSDELNVLMDGHGNVLVRPTTAEGSSPPLRLNLMPEGDTPTVRDLETRLRSLRQIYAVSYLIETDNMAASNDSDLLNDDLEDLIPEEDRLLIRSASVGSFWVTLGTTSKAAFNSLKAVTPLFFNEGRAATLERIRTKTESEKIAVDNKRLELQFRQMNNVLDVYERLHAMPDSPTRDRMIEVVNENIDTIGRDINDKPEEEQFLLR